MSDPKATSRRRDAASQAAQAIEKLLERIVQADSTQASPQVTADLTELIERVRAQYRALADHQIQAALEVALAADPGNEAETRATAPVATGHDEALDALEAMIRGPKEPQHASVEEPEVASNAPLEPVAQVESPEEEPDEDLFEGTVRLHVYPGGSMQRVVRFVDDIGKCPQFRLLRMSGNPQREGAEIDLGLREPTPLLETLRGMGHLAEPTDSGPEGIPIIAVHLHAAEVAQR